MTVIWSQHNRYKKELKTLKKSIRTIEKDIERVKKLLVAHFFNEETKGKVISPGKIHKITADKSVTGRELWKIEVMTPNVKPSLWPRLWFMLDGERITFLVVASHKTNYDNNELDRLAIRRYEDIIDS